MRICGPNWPFSQNTILPSLDHSAGQLVSTQHELQSLRSTMGNACQANKPTWWGGRAENQSVWRFHSSFITAVTWKQLARGRGGYTTGKYHVGAKSGMSVNHVNTWKYLWKTSLSKKNSRNKNKHSDFNSTARCICVLKSGRISTQCPLSYFFFLH